MLRTTSGSVRAAFGSSTLLLTALLCATLLISGFATSLPAQDKPTSRPVSKPAEKPDEKGGQKAEDKKKPSDKGRPAGRPQGRGDRGGARYVRGRPRPQAGGRRDGPPIASGSPESLALANQVRAFAAGPSNRWGEARRLKQNFLGRRRLLWDRDAGRVRVEFLDGDGAMQGFAVLQLDGKKLLASSAGTEGEQAGKLADQAHGAWVNDFYWLLIPLKVLDPGVQLAIEPEQEGDGEREVRLRLRFEKVGRTPQNQYVLHVDEDSGRILSWDYYADADAKPRSFRFETWTKVGPLRLALEHPATEGSFAVNHTEVEVNAELPDDVWTSSAELLAPAKKKD